MQITYSVFRENKFWVGAGGRGRKKSPFRSQGSDSRGIFFLSKVEKQKPKYKSSHLSRQMTILWC